MVELAGDAEVAQFADSILRDKNVLSLDVPVQYILIVHRHDSHDYVGERAQDLVRGELCLGLNSSLDQLVEVAFRTILHHDKDAVTVAEIFVELDNCWAFKHLKESDLTMGCFFIFLIHVVKVDFF